MTTKVLITESTRPIIKEEYQDGAEKRLYLNGIFLESERKNRNGRTYQRDEVHRVIDQVNMAAKNNRHVLGELDHPDERLDVKLENVSHRIVSMKMEGNDAIGKAEILNTPKGMIARSLIESNVTFGVSSRGTGSVNGSGIVEDFNFITVDLVANPSAIDAYPESVYESLQKYKRGDIVEDLAEAVLHDQKAQKYFEAEILKFIKEITRK